MTRPTILLIKQDNPVYARIYPTVESAESDLLATYHRLFAYSMNHAVTAEGYKYRFITRESGAYDDTFESARYAEHFTKYDAIARTIGVDSVRKLIGWVTDRETILQALSVGDFHLNTIPLRRWDSIAVTTAKLGANAVKSHFWISEAVCLLKHVATEYIAPNRR